MNNGTKALTTADEMKEIKAAGNFSMPNHDPKCTKAHLLLRYAFKQSGFGLLPDAHYWHVMSQGRSYHSTLSIDGLKEWGLI